MQQFKFVFTNEPVSDLPEKGPIAIVLIHAIMPDINIILQGIENSLNRLIIYKATGPDAVCARMAQND